VQFNAARETYERLRERDVAPTSTAAELCADTSRSVAGSV